MDSGLRHMQPTFELSPRESMNMNPASRHFTQKYLAHDVPRSSTGAISEQF